jgi:regulator of sigma E protease
MMNNASVTLGPYIDAVTKGFMQMGIIVFLLVLTLVVTIHEFGHYLACRATGIRVEKFGIGFGKPLLKYQREGGTEWSLRPWPLGGFIEPNKFEMAAAKPLTKAFVAVAGPAANIVPFGLLAAAFGFGGAFLKFIWILYWTGLVGLFNVITLPLRWLFGLHAVGATMAAAGGGTADKADLVGPVGLGSASVQATHAMGFGMSFLLLFILISLGLGLINLVPLPPLDGGRIALAGVEAVAGKKHTKRIEKYASLTGGLLMLIAFIIITSKDIIHLF